MKRLPPFIVKDKYYAAIEREIQRIFDDAIYRPLLRILGRNEFRNSLLSMRDMMRSGRIWYDDGYFYGRFNARASSYFLKLGAKYDSRKKAFKLERSLVPPDLLTAQVLAKEDTRKLCQQLLDKLQHIELKEADPQLAFAFEKTYRIMDKDFQENVKQISIPAQMTDSAREVMARDWAKNLNIYIQEWTNENIIDLREKVQAHALSGGRAEGLERMIAQNYGVSKAKAKFLARQETALAVSKYQETRYREIGITKYIWGSAADDRERKDHKRLNGTIQSWDNPPITDTRTGARNNAGEDYNCRCWCIPVIE
jgi:SPP1 gp7 family putative phage head morphogenesis protein